MNRRIKNKIFFNKKKAHLKTMVKNEFIEKDIAFIPCKVNSFDDIISHYSVKKYETLNPEFMEYINETIKYIPSEYPAVLYITGCKFNKEQQNTIIETIEADTMYELGSTELENKRQLKIFFFMIIGMILSGLFIFYKGNLFEGIPLEFLWVVFWFFADTLVGYVFMDRYNNQKKHIRAGRLASMKVYFSEDYDDSETTEKEIKDIYASIFGETNNN